MLYSIVRLGYLLACLHSTLSFAPTASVHVRAKPLYHHDVDDDDGALSRRGFGLQAAALWASLGTAAHADTGAEVRGIPVNAFNGLIFNYRGSDYAGLTADDLGDEPSIPYADFFQKLSTGDVTFVEFMAPAGDAAYATFKDGSSLRIGEGYPIEKADGYSSPTFAIRAVQNAGVPYKFTVPSLQKYQAKDPPKLRKL